MKSRRANVTLTYNGVDISADVSSYLLSFSFTDNAEGKADDLQVTLHDREGLWKGGWFPEKGATLTASIGVADWEKDGESGCLPCGTFSLDDVTASGPPDTFVLKGVSAMMDSSIRREKKTRAWENVSLSGIAGDMAKSAGADLFYDVPTDPHYVRRDQREQSDIAFLKSLCDDIGLSLKISNRKLVIFDSETYEKAAPVGTLKKSEVKTYSFSTKTADIYRACTIKYHDPGKKELQEYTYKATPEIPVGQVLQLRRRVESLAEAMDLAKKKLRQKNRHECTGSISLMGDVRISAGLNVVLTGFGCFDGVYHVESANHVISEGYTTSAKIRRRLDY